jgi:hypothetical protein
MLFGRLFKTAVIRSKEDSSLSQASLNINSSAEDLWPSISPICKKLYPEILLFGYVFSIAARHIFIPSTIILYPPNLAFIYFSLFFYPPKYQSQNYYLRAYRVVPVELRLDYAPSFSLVSFAQED